jgi:hypothetical protein
LEYKNWDFLKDEKCVKQIIEELKKIEN